ncbi:MAG: hypothetical protein M3071_04510 [Actinomycetota bacterium]|nr:hypothetical protein [Actinomycetota bacterium]
MTLRVHERLASRGGTATDHGTRVPIVVSLGVALALAEVLAHHGGRLFPGSRALGIALMWAGVALPPWAIFTLGDPFGPRSRSTRGSG